ncbi:uncharacterized protein MAM_02607 [Metarhizium album ARSEF 1941]|uniref:Uncharacterized protein n=1 Tax=Metarhizium album (strain ARSEF 1941) TaxID=1081103 RepID=A0A0B2X310_METAS|nr:uncharacterized protein MAM_02607 [Metarhizium album ARSEF 1941]KHN99754.1 hypothetical protein MAM_02607 [Metarhizium album ARSEF 1941]
MAEWHLPSWPWPTLARTLARGLAWTTDIAAIVVLCFVAQTWTATCGAVAPGIIGVSDTRPLGAASSERASRADDVGSPQAVVALLNDSWQMVAFADGSLGFASTRPHRTLMYDVFSLAVTLGGIVLMIVSNVQGGGAVDGGGIDLHKSTMAWLGMWLLTVVIVFRAGFALWACADCYKEYQRDARRYSGRTEFEQAEM